MVLGYSRAKYIEFVLAHDTETFMQCCTNFSLGGIDIPSELDSMIDLSTTRFDVMATYALPVALPEGASLKAIGGYSMTTTELTLPYMDEETEEFYPEKVKSEVKGFLIGAEGSFPVMDKLTINGMFGFGVGMKDKTESDETDVNLTAYQISADYKVMDNVSVEGGYISNKFSYDAGGNKTADGFYLGARANF